VTTATQPEVVVAGEGGGVFGVPNKVSRVCLPDVAGGAGGHRIRRRGSCLGLVGPDRVWVVLRRFGQCSLVVALALSLGLHWASLQMVAWTGMFLGHASVESWSGAWERTFDGQHPCALCLAIQEGRAAEKAAEETMPVRKLEWVPAGGALVPLTLPAPATARYFFHSPVTLGAEPPPVPPPRMG
jgi:hypothetical protein